MPYLECHDCGLPLHGAARWSAAHCPECCGVLEVCGGAELRSRRAESTSRLEHAHALLLGRRLGAAPYAPTAARHSLEGLRGVLDDGVLGRVRLLVSELVTNAVRHAVEGPIGVDVWAKPAGLRVIVSDAGAGFTPRRRGAGQDIGSGWGLFLVDELADRWGSGGGARMCVWFELELDAAAWGDERALADARAVGRRRGKAPAVRVTLN
jgi:signal transduction histidine kinase